MLGYLVDPLTSVMLVVVTVVALMVQVFSVGYMKGDPRFPLFYAYLNLFTAAMLGLVLANNLLLLYACWEVMGLASYLLIGFWFEKPAAMRAAKKAFMVTRLGDIGFFFGILSLIAATGTVESQRSGAGRRRPAGDRGRTGGGRPQGRGRRGHALGLDRPPDLLRRHRQERPVPAPRLAPGRDGGADAGLRPDPCRHDGGGGRVPGGADVPGLRGGRAGHSAGITARPLAWVAGSASSRRSWPR